MKSGLILSISGVLLIIAFSPKTLIADSVHYKFRMMADTAFMFWAFWRSRQKIEFDKIEKFFIQYWFILFLCSLYDDLLGDPTKFTFVELSVAITVTIIYYNIIKKEWKNRKNSIGMS